MSAALPAPVAAIVAAANAGDTAAFLAAFTPDGVVDDWGREFHGANEIAAWSNAEFIGVAVTLTVDDVEQGGETTIVSATVGGNGFNGPSRFSFEVVGGLVSRMTIRA